MVLLQNSAIERPVRLFENDMVLFGSMHAPAKTRTIRVLAQTAQDARRICRQRYGMCEILHARALVRAEGAGMPPL